MPLNDEESLYMKYFKVRKSGLFMVGGTPGGSEPTAPHCLCTQIAKEKRNVLSQPVCHQTLAGGESKWWIQTRKSYQYKEK